MELLQTSTRELEAMGKVPTSTQIRNHMVRSTALADLVKPDDDGHRLPECVQDRPFHRVASQKGAV